jgi:cellulose synthase/poly-beta-1,6-N-acetylglucosamine synthase-like glycosyltransferase
MLRLQMLLATSWCECLLIMVSFVVPAHNEEFLIGRTLEALHVAAGAMNEPYEIIVVDDASTDATATVAARCGAHVLSVHHRQIGAARNAGAAQAQGELLVFADADTHVSVAVVGAAVRAMRAGAVGGGARARFEGPVPIYGRILEWLWMWIQNLGCLASGCFLFWTRRAFEAVGGFDKTLYAAEDVVLSRRLRRLGRFVILPEVVVTSARNLRSHSAFEVLGILAGFALRGPEFFKTRHGPWYCRRRDHVENTAEALGSAGSNCQEGEDYDRRRGH